MIDRFAWLWFGLTAGVFGWVILISAFATPPREEFIQRGWFEHQGKVYRVVPAEVR